MTARTRIPSEFVPLDVNYPHDRAIRQAGPMAELLFIRGMAYARRTKSEGVIPDYDLPVVGVGIPKVAQHANALVRVRLWVSIQGGWRIRSWGKWNPVSEDERKAKQSRGGTLGNHNRWHVDGVTSDDCEFCGAIATESLTDQSTESLSIAEVEVEVEKRESEPKTSSSDVTYVPRGASLRAVPGLGDV